MRFVDELFRQNASDDGLLTDINVVQATKFYYYRHHHTTISRNAENCGSPVSPSVRSVRQPRSESGFSNKRLTRHKVLLMKKQKVRV